jgi:hypothetical protein
MHRTATKYVKQITVINTKVLTTKYTKWSWNIPKISNPRP